MLYEYKGPYVIIYYRDVRDWSWKAHHDNNKHTKNKKKFKKLITMADLILHRKKLSANMEYMNKSKHWIPNTFFPQLIYIFLMSEFSTVILRFSLQTYSLSSPMKYAKKRITVHWPELSLCNAGQCPNENGTAFEVFHLLSADFSWSPFQHPKNSGKDKKIFHGNSGE